MECSTDHCDRPVKTRGWCHACYERHRRDGDIEITNPRNLTDEQRLWAKVDKSGDCWEWTGAKANGYGRIWFGQKVRPAHRVTYELLVGPIPDGLDIDHLCRNRACVNPDHLEPVTVRVNLLRGIGAGAMNADKTHCKDGHPLSGDNIRVDGKGWRHCLTCERRRSSEAYYKRRPDPNRIKSATCKVCGVVFEYVGRNRRTMCSDECRKEDGRIAARNYARRKRQS